MPELSATCRSCQGDGWARLTQCPRKAVTRDIWESLRYLEFARRGMLPTGGGMLDQTEAFLSAFTRYNDLIDRIEAEKDHG